MNDYLTLDTPPIVGSGKHGIKVDRFIEIDLKSCLNFKRKYPYGDYYVCRICRKEIHMGELDARIHVQRHTDNSIVDAILRNWTD